MSCRVSRHVQGVACGPHWGYSSPSHLWPLWSATTSCLRLVLLWTDEICITATSLTRPLKSITCPSVSDQLATSQTVKHLLFALRGTCLHCEVCVHTAVITLNVEMSARKRKILMLEFSVGVITDVHSVPVPIETQDARTNPLSAYLVGVDGCGSCTWYLGWETASVLPPFLMGLVRGGRKWEGLL